MGGNVRVRFAPSPTGFLHVGGARTALFNWLFARKEGGVFILRIEDTDAEKSSDEMVRAITDSLLWLGLKWDEGPHFQSKRAGRHLEVADLLLEKGLAYRCFCSREKVESGRNAAMERGDPKVYPGYCRDLASDVVEKKLELGEPSVLRFRMPPGETTFKDAVYGDVTVENAMIGDFVLLRGDRSPTYNLAVVVDDSDMAITHVIRGEDHLSNTPKQIHIYKAMGVRPPDFIHLPLILGSDKSRLSKRHGATSVGAYREEGILPEALFNFLALLGWSPGDDRELMGVEEIVDSFSLDRVSRRGAIFDPAKLDWMNSQYFSISSADRLVELVTPVLKDAGLFDPAYMDREAEWYRQVLLVLSDRAHHLSDFVAYGRSFFTDDFDYDPGAVAKRWKKAGTVDYLSRSRDALGALSEFTHDDIEAVIRKLGEELGVSAAKLIHHGRVAVTGQAVDPGLFGLLARVGKEKTISRIDRAIDYLRSNPELTRQKPDQVSGK